jgi:hypothetical protein
MAFVASLLLCATLGRPAHSQGIPLKIADVAGCYALTVGEWSQPLRESTAFHLLPSVIRLDTAAASRGGRLVSPDISFPAGHTMRGTPRWEIIGDTIRVLWSNGFSPTTVWLGRSGDHLEGRAEASSDARQSGKPNWPRAKVVARPASCTQ